MMPISKAACVGGGVIGSSWAALFAAKGYPTALYDVEERFLVSARSRVEKALDSLMGFGLYTPEENAAAKARVTYTADIRAALSDADFIQESTPDSIDVKKTVFANIESVCSDDAIIASSTSNLLISEISRAARLPRRCIGAHPYNPPHLMPLVEITRAPETEDSVVKAAADFYRSCGKAPVVLQKESLGFVSNRLQMALYREAVNVVMSGICSVEDVDTVTTFGPALRWAILGPNMLFQLGGGAGGLKGLLSALKDGGDALIADLSTVSYQPPEWLDMGQAGVEAEMESMPDYIGKTPEEIAAFRDKMLVELLKLHHKL